MVIWHEPCPAASQRSVRRGGGVAEGQGGLQDCEARDEGGGDVKPATIGGIRGRQEEEEKKKKKRKEIKGGEKKQKKQRSKMKKQKEKKEEAKRREEKPTQDPRQRHPPIRHHPAPEPSLSSPRIHTSQEHLAVRRHGTACGWGVCAADKGWGVGFYVQLEGFFRAWILCVIFAPHSGGGDCLVQRGGGRGAPGVFFFFFFWWRWGGEEDKTHPYHTPARPTAAYLSPRIRTG